MKDFLRSITLVTGLALGATVFPSCQKVDPKAGSKTYDLTIVVVDASSCPVPDAKVTLDYQVGSSERTIALEAWTDKAGKCTFKDLRPLQGKVIIATDKSQPLFYPFEYNDWTNRVWEITWTKLPL